MPRLAGVLLATLLLVACSQSSSPPAESPTTQPGATTVSPDRPAPPTTTTTLPNRPPFCDVQWTPRATGVVTDPDLAEISGAAVSRANPGVLWVHNDSGDEAAVAALSLDGAVLGRITLPDLSARDWEDMAIGPGPDGSDHLYLADIGDNTASHASVFVHRIPEPPPVSAQLTGGETLEILYPDGPVEAESLLVDPTTGDLVILGKALSGVTPVFEVEPEAAWGSTATAIASGTISLGTFALATGADAGPTRVVVRTYDEAFLWERDPGESLAGTLLGPGCRVARIDEPQGEAIALTPGEDGFYTLSEGTGESVSFFTAGASS